MRVNPNYIPHTTDIIGVLLTGTDCGSGPTAHRTVRIGHRSQVKYAVSIENPAVDEALLGPLVPQRCRLVRQDGEENPFPLLLSISPEPEADGLMRVPELSCPRPKIVTDVQLLVASLDPPPLRQFVRDVLLRRDVHERFWTMPASAKHHHSRAGGLAIHSLEVANDIARHGELTKLERGLGIAGALLHDIGKVWSYTQDMFLTQAGLAMGHELLGAVRLEPQLARLEANWPDGAFVMRSLLAGNNRSRENGSMPSSLLPRIRACDQRSCEREAWESCARPRLRWAPREWRGERAPDDIDL
jgi:hypothetical protein